MADRKRFEELIQAKGMSPRRLENPADDRHGEYLYDLVRNMWTAYQWGSQEIKTNGTK